MIHVTEAQAVWIGIAALAVWAISCFACYRFGKAPEVDPWFGPVAKIEFLDAGDWRDWDFVEADSARQDPSAVPQTPSSIGSA